MTIRRYYTRVLFIRFRQLFSKRIDFYKLIVVAYWYIDRILHILVEIVNLKSWVVRNYIVILLKEPSLISAQAQFFIPI